MVFKDAVDSFSNQGIVFLVAQTLTLILHKKLHKTSYPQHLLKLHLYLNMSAAAGLHNKADMSANFTQTSTQTLVHQTPAQISSHFNQTGTPNITASIEATLDANFTQTSAASLVASGVAQIMLIYNSRCLGCALFGFRWM